MVTSYWTRVVRLCVVLCALSIWPAVSAASTSCESNFKELKTQDGGTFYMTLSSYEAIGARQALDQYKRIAADQGYELVAPPDYSAAEPGMAIGRSPSPNPIMIMITRQASTISLTTIVARGTRANAEEERARLCELVAQFDAGRSGAGQGRGPRQTSEQLREQSRTTIPEAIPSMRVLSPSVPFDRSSAKAALEPGRSVIRGQACGTYNGSVAFAAGSKVLLYPATPYWEQLVRISKKAKPGKDQVVPDPEAVATRMEATANSKGEFQFSQMKPGRYFLVTVLSVVLGGSRDVYAGRVEGAYSSANVYTTEDYTFDAANELSEFVEVRNDGDLVKVTLQPPITANPFHRGLGGSILGCRQLP